MTLSRVLQSTESKLLASVCWQFLCNFARQKSCTTISSYMPGELKAQQFSQTTMSSANANHSCSVAVMAALV